MRLQEKTRLPLIRSVGIGVVVLLLVLFFPWIEDLERFSLDQRFLLRGPRPPLKDVVIIGIDTDSIVSENRPLSTWNPIHAEVIEGLVAANPACVFLDQMYNTRIDPVIRELVAGHLGKFGIQVPPPILNRLGFDTPLSEACINARKANLPVILAFFSQKDFHSGMSSAFAIFRAENALVNLTMDPDQAIRSLPLFSLDQKTGTMVPAAALAIASKLKKAEYLTSPGGDLVFNNQVIANLNREHEGTIDFAGPRGTYEMVPYKELLAGARKNPESLKRFAGKALLIGLWQYGDSKNVPFGKMYGIEVHANAVENLLSNRFLKRYGEGATILLCLGFLALQTFFFGQGLRFGTMATVVLVFAWSGACQWAFGRSVIFPFARPVVFLLVQGLAEGFWLYYSLQAESKKVRNLFCRYVNDSVIEAILKSSGTGIMQGKRCRICVMFSDIRGFTSFSEGRDPVEVVAFLNRYFEGLTEIILRKDGVIDKFLGDGLMAFFNAPIEKETFLRDSVEAALEVRTFINQPEIRELAGSFEVKTGIGLHVGEVLVGNIGSTRKMEFTAIGDTVNTASRMEALNKEFGTDIIASQEIFEATKEWFDWKYLGEKTLRGKEKTVQLYHLVGRKTS